MSRRSLYFAYGSNLDPAQMMSRCSTAEQVGTAYLADSRISFAGRSRMWSDCGVATVLPADDGQWVDGLVWRMTTRDLVKLDKFEGHPWCYIRIKVGVRMDETGRIRRVWVYVKRDDTFVPPHDDYFGTIARAYRRLGFDKQPLRSGANGGE